MPWVWIIVGLVLLVGAGVYFFGGLIFGSMSTSTDTDCVISCPANAWSECNRPCNGYQFAQCTVSTYPSGNGAACDWSLLVQSRTCNVGASCPARDCVPGIPDPNGYSGCPPCLPQGVSTAVEWQFVAPLSESVGSGRPCSFADTFVTRQCAGNIPTCAVDSPCQLTPAPQYTTPCSEPCGGGVQYAVFGIASPPSGNGAPCDWSQISVPQQCNTQSCPASDNCGSVWGISTVSAWSECSVACGPGTQYQTRLPVDATDNCPLIQSQTCVMAPCQTDASNTCKVPTVDDAVTFCLEQCMGAGSAGTNSDGTWVRSSDGQLMCGTNFPSVCNITQLGLCPAPSDCQLTDFAASSWSDCSQWQCDKLGAPQGGLQFRTRQIVAQAQGGGVPCSEFPLIQYQPCNNTAPVTLGTVTYPPQCTPVDCVLSAWSTASQCSAPCGPNGTQIAVRSVTTLPSGGGAPCPTDPAQYMTVSECNRGTPCSDCVYETWDAYIAREGLNWGLCSGCDGVQSMGPRRVIQPAVPGGSCDPSQAFQQRTCCPNCQCEVCPVGCNNQACSGRGQCSTVTSVCTCDEGFYGPACQYQCPVDSNGLVCGGRGVCGPQTNGTCSCDGTITGTYCDMGGSCLISLLNVESTNHGSLSLPTFCVPNVFSTGLNGCEALNGQIIMGFGSSANEAFMDTVQTKIGTLSCADLGYANSSSIPFMGTPLSLVQQIATELSENVSAIPAVKQAVSDLQKVTAAFIH